MFTRTKRGADRVAQHLADAGVGAVGDSRQQEPEPAPARARRFSLGRARVLVATDIAARGIDVDGVTHVVNFELPETPEAYVHRIGRTARAGAAGRAISLCDNGERRMLRAIEKLTRQTIESTDRRTQGGRPAPDDAPARRAPPQHRRPQERSRADQSRHGQGRPNGPAPRAETPRAARPKRRPQRGAESRPAG